MKMKLNELLKKENENRTILYVGLLIVILIILSGIVNKVIVEKALEKREQQIIYSKEITACQKGCNQMLGMSNLNDSNVFPCLEFCNRYYEGD